MPRKLFLAVALPMLSSRKFIIHHILRNICNHSNFFKIPETQCVMTFMVQKERFAKEERLQNDLSYAIFCFLADAIPLLRH